MSNTTHGNKLMSLCLGLVAAAMSAMATAASAQALSRTQQAIAPIAAATAVGDIPQLMKVLDARKQRGTQDAPGRNPSGPLPVGKDLLALGTANQTKLSGAPVRGPLFEFAPQVDEYLKTHLFGDIFGRDNLDWQSREVRGQPESARRTRAAIQQVLPNQ